MPRLEIGIVVQNDDYVDSLITALVRQGYEVYYREDENCVLFTIDKDETTEIEDVKT